MWYVCDVLHAVLYVRVSCFVVRRCAVSRRYINVCNCDMFSVLNVYLDHLKFCVVCINGRRYVCCSECNVVSNGCNVCRDNHRRVLVGLNLISYSSAYSQHISIILLIPHILGQINVISSSSWYHQTILFHRSGHCFPTSLNIIRSSKEQGCASWEQCNMLP